LSAPRRPSRVHAPFPACGGALTALANGRILRKRDVAIDPVAHLARPDAPKRPGLAPALQRKHGRAVEAVSGEPDHLAVLRAARIGAPRGKVEEYVGGGDKKRVCEEDLGVGGRLVGEEHYERRTPFVEDRTEDEVDLGEAGRASLVLKCMLKARI